MGQSMTGKTEILYQIVLNVVLPPVFGDLKLNGQGQSLVFIDLDYRFNMDRLEELLGYRIYEGLNELISEKPAEVQEQIFDSYLENLKDEIYEKIFLVTCQTTSELLRAIENIGEVKEAQKLQSVLKDSKYSLRLLIIDNLSAFYWQDRVIDDGRQYSKISSALVRTMKKHRLSTIFTSGLFHKHASGVQEKLSWDGGGIFGRYPWVTHRVLLRKDNPVQLFAGIPGRSTRVSLNDTYSGRFVHLESPFSFRIKAKGVVPSDAG